MKIYVIQYGEESTNGICLALFKLGYEYNVIHPLNKEIYEKPDKVILSGGPDSTTIDGHLDLPDWIFDLNVPIMGICYGMQLIAKHLGGEIVKGKHVKGYRSILNNKLLLSTQKYWMNYEDKVIELPSEIEILAYTYEDDDVNIASFRYKNIYAVQWHPERDLSDLETFRHFLQKY